MSFFYKSMTEKNLNVLNHNIKNYRKKGKFEAERLF